MGRSLGMRQLEIADLLRKRPLTAKDLAQLIYKKEPTRTLMNITWNSLRGMERRRMIKEAGKTIQGWGRWELTSQGRKDIEALKSTENVSVFPGS